MNLTVENNPHWPAFLEQFEQLTDAQLARLCQTDGGRDQLVWLMIGGAMSPADDQFQALRKRIAKAMNAAQPASAAQ